MKFSDVKGEKMYTPREVATMLNVSPTTVRDWIFLKKLTAFKIGGRFRIPESSLEFECSKKEEPKPDPNIQNIQRLAEIELARQRLAEKFGIKCG